MEPYEVLPAVRRAERPGDGSKLLVVGFDDSRGGRAALAFAAGLARREHARLIAVLLDKPAPLLALAPWAVAAARDAYAQTSARLVAEVEGRLAELGVRHDVLVREGDAVDVLEAVASGHSADAVIVGLPRHGGRRAAARLLRRARQPVVAVPSRGE